MNERLPILVIPPKVSRLRRLTYPLWSFWANKVRWPLVCLYIDFRKAIGPRCGDCGERYWRTCLNCELLEFARQRRLDRLRSVDDVARSRSGFAFLGLSGG